MLGSSSFSSRLRGSLSSESKSRPSWVDGQVTPVLQSLSRRACTHPIHTLVFVGLLASTTYIGLLEGSLLGQVGEVGNVSSRTDWDALIKGSKTLCVGESTGWKWRSEEEGRCMESGGSQSRHLALMTLVFPDSLSARSPQTAPTPHAISSSENSSIQLLPSTLNPLSPYSQDSTLAFAIPHSNAPDFLPTLRELPRASADDYSDADNEEEESRWVMKAATIVDNAGRRSFKQWTQDAFSGFLDLLKKAETLDIIIMFLGYLSMHLTFVSLFFSMRRMGSNFWLAATVLCSCVFAFLFGLTVTTKMGVPLNVVLLSEGLPFLVVTIGFDKPIALTKAVLSASLNARQHPITTTSTGRGTSDNSPMTIQYAVQAAVRDKGYEIVRDYFIEILILVAGAASGVQGGLRQFCFLAAWILFFDCLLLFTFYTAVLSVKLEINRIKRHMTLQKALEDDGVSRRVAENVARSNEWPKSIGSDGDPDNASNSYEMAIFGKKVKESSVPRFKILMVVGFILINLINIGTISFRSRNKYAAAPTVSGLSKVVTPPAMDPFKVASKGLDYIYETSIQEKIPTVVTVLAPIKYKLQYASTPYRRSTSMPGQDDLFSGSGPDYMDGLFDGVGGRVVDSLLKSLEDPVLSKWIILALAISLVLNGYLFNAARWGIKDSNSRDEYERRLAQDMRSKALPVSQSPIDAQFTNKTIAGTREVEDELSMEVSKRNDHLPSRPRTLSECEIMVKEKRVPELTDVEIINLSLCGKIPGYALEKTLGDPARAVKIRRAVVSRTPGTSTTAMLEKSLLPHENYDYAQVLGACCENVIGYMPIPLGVAGPLVIDGQSYFLPMATTEGVLVASTSRGCKAIMAGGGAVTVLTGDGMTRGPCVSFETLQRAGAAKLWLDSEIGQKVMKKAFDSTSRFARLQSMKTAMAGTYLYIRFKTTTGDAMGMNMISKGVEHALDVMANESGFDDMSIVSVSGNFCTDKKPAAINWIDGRGKGVVAEAIIPGRVVQSVLKSSVDALVELNISKNLIGSAMAGSIGGFNAHAANIVTAIFIATGQDPAQNVESSNCITTMKNLNGNLQINVSLPSIEVGTIGGGTVLEPQGAMLDLLGVRGPHATTPGDNARQLARIVAAAVLAGELSLCSALAAGHLVKSHMAHNRSTPATRAGTPVSSLHPARMPSLPGGGSISASGISTPVSMAMTSIRDRSGGE
ncbi:MAG: 3-hydroxy-3-methylglutaryl-coenzyme A (HMG-CoA) reductase isozyme [Peltula sp. TS41687]|nr:MAG: 3-hydroxy-3-methylglutaryl-coenzyme A (HMG-CoA) reductase isozyme [Peltula sp. TS41687]